MKIEKKFFQHLRKGSFFKEHEKILVAFSGGGDSVSLVQLLLSVQNVYHLDIHLAYVNHDLRKTSLEEERFVRQFASQYNLPLHVKKWQEGKKLTSGIEVSARNFRYDFFAELLKREHFTKLLTAHHADDLTETIVMKLIRGSHFFRLSSLSERRKFQHSELIRLLLPFSKSELEEYLQEKNQHFIFDESNESSKYFRNRVRNEVLPFIKKENPAYVQAMNNFSKTNEYLRQFLQKTAQGFFKENLKKNTLSGLKFLSREERFIYLMMFFENRLEINKHQLEETLNLLEGKQFPKEVQLTNGNILQIHADNVTIL
ncbi:tRNA(Ile)-lysidine synthetase, N-terminal domain-containing protein [Pilibacter termitis]|uniref:tRNA(Ile)-lysidine synthase n=1 Tax=Pilibacter termitis TaxID=263852 RepID=A0A1T4MD46_9ENTE|nr:tRNA lysidine(34) synthetase TilS [Pilibacter termitis]SJZ64674.1 tRNA(Ile)-lysidine synthetase, N-terminal domain-containing protein [Pilibacter termitis]